MNEEITLNGVKYKAIGKTKDDGNKDCNGCENCRNCTRCNNSTGCDNSTWCDNSTGCNNCVHCIYCCDLVLEKYMAFNKQLTKEEYEKVEKKIQSHMLYYMHPKNLKKKDIDWLKKNIKQFDQKVLDKIIKDSILPDKPKEV